MAEKMLPKFNEGKNFAYDLDNAKFQLLKLEIQQQLNQPMDDTWLRTLFYIHAKSGADWEKIGKRYNALLQSE